MNGIPTRRENRCAGRRTKIVRHAGSAHRKKGGRALANYIWQKRAAAGMLTCLLASSSLPLTAYGAKAQSAETTQAETQKPEETPADTGGDLAYEEQQTYSDYYDIYQGEPRPDAEIMVYGADFKTADCGAYETFVSGSSVSWDNEEIPDNTLIWNSADGSFTYEVSVPETGLYSIETSYCPISSNTSEISFSLAIDGEIPYDTASRLNLNKVYVNKEEIKTDSSGNQIRPSQIQTEIWQTCWIGDSDGLFNEPLFFYLEKGTHEITISSEKAYFALAYLRFAQPEETPTYDEYVSSTDTSVTKESTPSGVVRIEGESAVYKSDSVLYPTYDNSTSAISPSDPKHMLYNTIGSGNWNKALQTITWQVDAGTLPGYE